MPAQAIFLFSLACFEVANAAANRVRIADVAPVEFGRPSINVAPSMIDDIEKTIMQDEDRALFRTLFMGSMSLSYDSSENGGGGPDDTENGADGRAGTDAPEPDSSSATTTAAAAATSSQSGSGTATAAAGGMSGGTSGQSGPATAPTTAAATAETVEYTGEESASDTGGSTGAQASSGSVGAGSGAVTTGSQTDAPDAEPQKSEPQKSAPAPTEGGDIEKAALSEETPLSGSSDGGGNTSLIIGATVGTAVMAILAFAAHKLRSAHKASGSPGKDVDTLASEPPSLDESLQQLGGGANEV